MTTISPQQLNQLLSTQPGLPLLDVRTPSEFAEVHVGQAKNIPLGALNPAELARSGELRKQEPVYLLCLSGKRAANAAESFAREGYLQPIVVAGGTQAWLDDRLPVIRGPKGGISLERQVRIAAGSLVLAGVLLGWRLHPGFFGLSAFVGAGLVFAGITDFCGMGLLLAKAPWNTRVRP